MILGAACMITGMCDPGVSADDLRVGAVAIPKRLLAGTQQPLKGKRVGWYKHWSQHADPPVVDACTSALKLMEKLGAEVCSGFTGWSMQTPL